MPCYSSVQVAMTDVDSVEKAAAELGITVIKHSADRYTLSKGGEHITIQRRPGEKKFETASFTGSNFWPDKVLRPLLQSYAKVQVKKFAAKRGMTVSAGAKPGQYILSSYRG